MPYPSVKEFEKILLTLPLEEIVQEHLFGGEPYVFRTSARAHTLLKQHVSQHLNTPEDDIRIVGSARIGFSLSPDSFGRQFSAESDIDVIVINEQLFDLIWMTLLRWHYPRRNQPFGSLREWASSRRRDVFLGWFTPHQIQFNPDLPFPQVLSPLRDHAALWFDTFRSLARYPEFAKRDVSGRLYRTWDHALLYHVAGLSQIKQSIPGAPQ